MVSTDVAIIGGGIVGLATGFEIQKALPGLKVTVIEKEDTVGSHQSGHNSGVIHSSIYYKPGSLKARCCRAGRELLINFCKENNLKYEICGKVIVATQERELSVLEDLYQRGVANGVVCQYLTKDELKEREPFVEGIKGIYVADAGITDYSAVCQALSNKIISAGGTVITGVALNGYKKEGEEQILYTTAESYNAKTVVNCAGLHSDRVAKIFGIQPKVQIIPFRGEYYLLRSEASIFCKNLIYPVPDPNFPFLGVHFTRMINGGVECGPNAVLAFSREGYSHWDLSLSDLAETFGYVGFRKLASKYWLTGLSELWRSFSKQAFLRSVQKLVPDVTSEDLIPGGAGVRAQAVDYDGKLIDDFYIESQGRVINLLNAPSPAATGSFEIGRMVAEMVGR